MLSFIKSIPVTLAPNLANPSETKPPPHPKSRIDNLLSVFLLITS